MKTSFLLRLIPWVPARFLERIPHRQAADLPRRADPLELFEEWFVEAKRHKSMSEPTAVTLATADAMGMPSARVVLLKGVSERGFVFYTNLGSDKAVQLDENPLAALCFHWMPLNKQVRVQGRVERVSDEEADAYFATRPAESQIGAWASKQSKPLESTAVLLRRVGEYAKEFSGRPVPRPPFWSGYRLVPDRIEFWLRGDFRLHHRLRYERRTDGQWSAQGLYP